MAYSPTTEDLEAQVVNYLKDTRQYSQIKLAGDLDEYIKVVVEATQWTATTMIGAGEMESAAWFAAIRQHILHREAD